MTDPKTKKPVQINWGAVGTEILNKPWSTGATLITSGLFDIGFGAAHQSPPLIVIGTGVAALGGLQAALYCLKKKSHGPSPGG